MKRSQHFVKVSSLLAVSLIAANQLTAGIVPNGVNLQPSYYNNGNVNMGWSLMNGQGNIQTVRIEIEPTVSISQVKTWISQARSNGKTVIATYHKSSVLGSDSTTELQNAANWWKANYSSLASSGSFTINLMNEWGSHNISSSSYASAYNSAISTVRSVYGGTIIIDIPGWGQETHTAAGAVTGSGGTRINDGNIALSTHIYPGDWNQALNHWLQNSDLDEMGNVGRSCIVGEFGTGSGSADWSGLVDHAKSKGWPVLAWSWNGDGGSLNMVTPTWSQNPTATSFSLSGYFNTVYPKLGGGGGGGDTAVYNFESGTQGWAGVWGSIASVGQSGTQKFAGSSSLRVSINKTTTTADGSAVGVSTPANAAGKTVTLHVWLPSNIPIQALQPFAQTGTGWTWTGNWTTGITRGAWNTVTINVPNTNPVQRIGVEFDLTGTFSGDCYVDAVNY